MCVYTQSHLIHRLSPISFDNSSNRHHDDMLILVKHSLHAIVLSCQRVVKNHMVECIIISRKSNEKCNYTIIESFLLLITQIKQV